LPFSIPYKITSATDPVASAESADADIAEAIAEVYVLRAYFTNQLDALYATAKAEYLALTPKQRTAARQTQLLVKYIQTANHMETDCDARMDAIINKLQAGLIRTGGDAAIVDEIKSEYAQEKSLKKAYYFSIIYKNK